MYLGTQAGLVRARHGAKEGSGLPRGCAAWRDGTETPPHTIPLPPSPLNRRSRFQSPERSPLPTHPDAMAWLGERGMVGEDASGPLP